MSRRDIVIGLIIVAVLAGVILIRQRNSGNEDEMRVPETLSSVEEQIEDKFNLQFPDDVDKAELKSVSEKPESAIATRKFENGTFTATVLADLPDSEPGSFYQAWLVKGEEGEEGYAIISMGKLQIAKGGWMVSFESNTDYSDYSKVLLTSEKVSDNSPEEGRLRGSF